MDVSDNNLFVVGIGASAGGLDAIQQLFDHMPTDTGMSFVIIQHLSPDFKSLMPELLAKHTKMKIFTAEDQQTIKPNCIYLNQRDKNLKVKGYKFVLSDKGPKNNLNLPIDIFFRSLGEEHKSCSVGIILSGTGSDGTKGIRTIKETGGTIIVQEPSSAQFDGMPNSAISTNFVDHIQKPGEIAAILLNLAKHHIQLNINTVKKTDGKPNEVVFLQILEEIRKGNGIDFRKYKENTLLRRLEKRMSVNNIDSLHNYYTFLQSSVREKEDLAQDFLIGVTSFFRDIEAFNVLRNSIVPQICKNKNDTETIRIWVAGCSTGEEAYSIAMLFDEYIRLNRLNFDFKIFATDVDTHALYIAGNGNYSPGINHEIFNNFMEDYFVKAGDSVQAKKRIRERIVFSSHNLLSDPPFIKMDFVSCRNLLIYLDNKSQQKVLSDFQHALNMFGFLFLGNSESLGEVGKSFRVIDSKWKIFQNISESKQPYMPQINETTVGTLTIKNPAMPLAKQEYRYKENPSTVFYKYLSDKYSPSCIFVNDDFNIFFIKGDAGKRLVHQEGIFQNNLLEVVPPNISDIIKNGIRALKTEGKNTIVKGVPIGPEDNQKSVDISFYKPDAPNLDDAYIIQFSEDEPLGEDKLLELKNLPADEISKQKIKGLEEELKEVKARLRNAIEELEINNEELQSSNEELMTSNEELQSTNEELQSVNEELHAVNSELQEKNKELQELNNDMINLLNSTQIGTLFLDMELKIRKFTPELQKHFDLEENDIGRTISSFASNFNENVRKTIIENSKKTLANLINHEEKIVDSEGNFYLLRISPFVTADKKIDGVVITFVGINLLEQTREKLQISQRKYKQLFKHINIGLLHGKIITDQEGNPVDYEYLDVNPTYEEQTGLKKEDIIGTRATKTEPKMKSDTVDWLKLYGHTAKTGERQTVEVYSDLQETQFILNVFSPGDNEFAAAYTDITYLKEIEKELLIREQELIKVQKATQTGSWYLDFDTERTTWSGQLFKMYGLDVDDPILPYTEQYRLYTGESWDVLSSAIENIKKTHEPYEHELQTVKKDGTNGWVWVRGEVILDEGNEAIGIWGATQDITKYKTIERDLVDARKKADSANIHKNYFLANMSHEIRTPMNSVLGFSDLLKDDEVTREERDRYIEIIDSNAHQLLKLIDDIIDVASIESNQLKISMGECKVAQMLSNLKEIHTKNNKLKPEVRFVLNYPEEYKNLSIKTDCGRLQQVISNLLNNALKFSDKGSINFGFNIEDEGIAFYVKDQGIGIPQEKIDEIFTRFNQLNYGKEAVFGGTGLGLAISKGITELLGGSIVVDSVVGQGSEFKVAFPSVSYSQNKPVETKAQPKTDYNNSFKGKKILIAEDEPLVQIYFKATLKAFDLDIVFANDGEEAVNLYNNDIDIVLMDIRMPKMNGYEAIEKILETNPAAKIIVHTAYAMVEEKEKCIKAGCVGYINKPISRNVLLEELKKHLS